ncbi:thiamine pyrophosphate-binding protein [Yinghuangia soli]|uniref:Thiamine pyrophosphate-dependent enzyme n=1 Tax=Yinghuangia soli TaxID=2908204 RepID=A0AA41PYS9_9ACTN|nr:thiamine pyrophosphate-dependent enzyme [Yinghuangia soli]MCF2527646.1 thiamine pyrophosphate-dependent enzyme [Yinghuangia soli]
MTLMTGAQALAAQLHREGVTRLFGLPGDQIMHLLDALHDEPGIAFTTTRHEQATTYMADGYARISGREGCALVVPGIGLYNAGAGLATAYAASSPVLLLAGQIPRDAIDRGTGALHEIHRQLDIVAPVAGHTQGIRHAADVPAAVHRAFAALRTGRPRPAVLDIPPEALAEKADVTLLDAAEPRRTAPDPDAVRAAAALLRNAERPLLWAGGGAVTAGAHAALTAIAEHLQTPIVTTREGKGAVDDRHPLSVGTMWFNPRLRPVLDDADAVLAIGTRFTGSGIAPHIPLVHIDADPTEFDRQHTAAVAVAADAALAAEALLAELRRTCPPRPSRTAETQAMRTTVDRQLAAIGPQAAIVDTLRATLPDDAVLIPCTTTVGYMCHMRYPVHTPRGYLATSYMGTLGFAFPTGLGAKAARPDLPVVTVNGDGGFLFAAAELATAVQYGINTVNIVFDDGAYGNSNRDQRERFGGREIGTTLHNPDWARLARSFGAYGLAVGSPADLGPALRDALAADRPTVISVPIPRLPSPF